MRRMIALAAVLVLALVGWIGIRDARRGYRSTRNADVVRFTLRSPLTHRDLHEIVVVPGGGGQGRELLVFLHGRGSSPSSNLSQPFFDELHALGRSAPVVLLADGGDHSYWHDRADGRWGTSVLREAIPAALARTHADPHRIAIGGISMGGFGALDLARLSPRTFCAVGAHSPALWFSGGDTAAGAFDDAEDFARHDVIAAAHTRRLDRVPVWTDGRPRRSVRASRHDVRPGATAKRHASRLPPPRRRPRRLDAANAAVPALLQPGMSVVTVSPAWRSRRERSPSAP